VAQSNRLTDTLLGSGSVKALSEISGASEDQVQQALSSALPTLIESMKKNSASLAGEMALSAALANHAGRNSGDAASFLKGANADDGSKIIGHILGGERSSIESAISKKAGIYPEQVAKILSSAAPLVMNIIGSIQKQKKEEGSFGGLIEVLSSVSTGAGAKEGGLGDLFKGGFGSLFSSSKKSAEPDSAKPLATKPTAPPKPTPLKPAAPAKPAAAKPATASEKPIAEKVAAKKPVAKKPVAKQAVAKKTAAKKPAAKKPVAKQAVAKKAADKKPAAKKPVAKKGAVKKVAVKKPAAKKPVAKKAVAKKVAAKKPAAKKPVAKKTAVKKAVIKKAVAKKATAKKPAKK